MARLPLLALLAAASASALANVGGDREAGPTHAFAPLAPVRPLVPFEPVRFERAADANRIFLVSILGGQVLGGQGEGYVAASRVAPRRRSPRWIIPNVRKKWYFAEARPVNGSLLVSEPAERSPVEVSVGIGLDAKGWKSPPASLPERD